MKAPTIEEIRLEEQIAAEKRANLILKGDTEKLKAVIRLYQATLELVPFGESYNESNRIINLIPHVISVGKRIMGD